MILPETTPVENPPSDPTVTPPPFGDLSTRELIGALIAYCQGHPSTRRLDLGRRGATPDDVRRELRRRSAVADA